jgi:hypothetical protein
MLDAGRHASVCDNMACRILPPIAKSSGWSTLRPPGDITAGLSGDGSRLAINLLMLMVG